MGFVFPWVFLPSQNFRSLADYISDIANVVFTSNTFMPTTRSWTFLRRQQERVKATERLDWEIGVSVTFAQKGLRGNWELRLSVVTGVMVYLPKVYKLRGQIPV